MAVKCVVSKRWHRTPKLLKKAQVHRPMDCQTDSKPAAAETQTTMERLEINHLVKDMPLEQVTNNLAESEERCQQFAAFHGEVTTRDGKLTTIPNEPEPSDSRRISEGGTRVGDVQVDHRINHNGPEPKLTDEVWSNRNRQTVSEISHSDASYRPFMDVRQL
ncbi:unnamed protein product [Bursaphelenchus okinawaensis]|uniref:Uncharacterized protein n=1 Tax=Bursaphelenchus okinawaensis TaxID=465554 RepID=A0A811JQ99_9BILA|nr:unnamed protein product [Bursaphelenchus okinawaensis]CAG9077777.1 unnamed protein product [Bursaphelenchus okinawaensis]